MIVFLVGRVDRRGVLSRLKKKAEDTIARRPRRKRVAIDVEKRVICDVT